MNTPAGSRSSSVDAADVYRRTRERFVTLARGLSADALDTAVPATPAWRVRDALAHVVGITADLNAGRFGRDDPERWTTDQVDARRGRSVDELAAEWERESVRFEEGLRLFGYGLGSHYVGDLHAHLQDVHQALGLPRVDDDETVLVALDFYVEAFDTRLREVGAPAVELLAGDERHVAGSGEPQATLRAPAFEVLRTLSGRRSIEQVRALDWTGDVDAAIAHISRYPLAEHPIVE